MQRSAHVAAPARLGVRRLAPPKSLAALLAIVISVGLAWALVVPPWQSPDELAQFGFVQSLAENFTIPHTAGAPQNSSDVIAADAAVGASRGAFWPAPAPPDWSHADYSAYLAAEHAVHPSRSDGNGPSTATNNPPLFYLVAAVPYLIDHGGTAFGRLYSVRLLGVLLLLVTTIGAWLLAGEVFGRRRLPQLGLRRSGGAASNGLLHVHRGQPGRAAHGIVDVHALAGRAGDQPPRPGVGRRVAVRGDGGGHPDQGDVLRPGRPDPDRAAHRLAPAPGRRARAGH